MARLTIDIPDSTHHQLRLMAANHGITIRDYVIDKITPDLNPGKSSEPSLSELAAAWEDRRKGFKLERGDRSLRDMIHEGHKW